MTIEKAFNHLLKEWEDQPKWFRDKYRSYRSRYEKSKGMKAKEIIEKRYYVGTDKMREMLLKAGYTETPADYKAPKK
jgi:hypothetical protein